MFEIKKEYNCKMIWEVMINQLIWIIINGKIEITYKRIKVKRQDKKLVLFKQFNSIGQISLMSGFGSGWSRYKLFSC